MASVKVLDYNELRGMLRLVKSLALDTNNLPTTLKDPYLLDI